MDNRQIDNPLELPCLDEIFEALRKGQHICEKDGTLYYHLRQHQQVYGELFAKLGFDLVADPHGFYYFRGTDNVSDLAARMAVFMFILIEWLADRGRGIEEALLTEEFVVADLPHWTTERYQGCMREVGVVSEEDLDKVVANLQRLGFADRQPGDSIRFRTPVYRFLDLCQEIQEQGDNRNGEAE